MALKRCGTCNGAGQTIRRVKSNLDPAFGPEYVEQSTPCTGECGGGGWISVPDKR